jgi:hypothetical protein
MAKKRGRGRFFSPNFSLKSREIIVPVPFFWGVRIFLPTENKGTGTFFGGDFARQYFDLPIAWSG